MNFAQKIQRLQWLQILDRYRNDNESNRSFAKRIGLNHGIITSWEKGDTPKINIVNQIRDKLQLSDKDYSDIMWLTNRVLVAASALTRKKIEDELLDAENLPKDHVCALLLAKKPGKQPVQRYISSIGFSVERWIELARDINPKLTLEELHRLLHSPVFESDPAALLELINACGRKSNVR